MKTAIIFPGQGCQYVGMGKEFYKKSEIARNIIDELKFGGGFDLVELIFNGPQESLAKTIFAQPCIYTISHAIYRSSLDTILDNKNLEIKAFAGHSVGEYNAITAAEGLGGYKEGFFLVNNRGRYMNTTEGGLVSLIGFKEEELDEICNDYHLELSLRNSKSQFVLGGGKLNIQKFAAKYKKDKEKRAIILKVTAPFHTSLLKEKADEFKTLLEERRVYNTSKPIYQNYSAQSTTDSKTLVEGLHRQFYQTVRWSETIENMVNSGIEMFIEIGPKPVLSKMINEDYGVRVKTASISKPDDLKKIKEL